MKRFVMYFDEGNLTPADQWEATIEQNEIDELKEVAAKYPNGRIYTNAKGNLCICYGRYINEIEA